MPTFPLDHLLLQPVLQPGRIIISLDTFFVLTLFFQPVRIQVRTVLGPRRQSDDLVEGDPFHLNLVCNLQFLQIGRIVKVRIEPRTLLGLEPLRLSRFFLAVFFEPVRVDQSRGDVSRLLMKHLFKTGMRLHLPSLNYSLAHIVAPQWSSCIGKTRITVDAATYILRGKLESFTASIPASSWGLPCSSERLARRSIQAFISEAFRRSTSSKRLWTQSIIFSFR